MKTSCCVVLLYISILTVGSATPISGTVASGTVYCPFTGVICQQDQQSSANTAQVYVAWSGAEGSGLATASASLGSGLLTAFAGGLNTHPESNASFSEVITYHTTSVTPVTLRNALIIDMTGRFDVLGFAGDSPTVFCALLITITDLGSGMHSSYTTGYSGHLQGGPLAVVGDENYIPWTIYDGMQLYIQESLGAFLGNASVTTRLGVQELSDRPVGVTWTSQSGVFQQQIPEPSSLSMAALVIGALALRQRVCIRDHQGEQR